MGSDEKKLRSKSYRGEDSPRVPYGLDFLH